MHRWGEGYKDRGIRGGRDEPWDPLDPELDPFREMREEDFLDPANEEYIWPGTEEEEDD